MFASVETQDSLSDDALMPLKSYKYSSVDKSWISNYILRHYVWISFKLHSLHSDRHD